MLLTLRQAITIVKWLGHLTLSATSIYIIYLSILIFMLSRGLYLRSIEDASSKNARGDRVFAETDFSGGDTHPWKTVIWLKRSGGLVSTTLLKAYSFDALVGLKWQDNDNLVLRLDFGCDAAMSAPVERVGSIHITYRFGESDHAPDPGYESAPRPDSRKPCN